MMQIYTKKTTNFEMKPNREVINFLLNFSKSYKVIKTKKGSVIGLNLN